MELWYGKDMVTHTVNYLGDKETWYLPEGVEIDPDALYKIDYDFHDASDPFDGSCSYRVTFIEKVPDDIRTAYLEMKRLKRKVSQYLYD